MDISHPSCIASSACRHVTMTPDLSPKCLAADARPPNCRPSAHSRPARRQKGAPPQENPRLRGPSVLISQTTRRHCHLSHRLSCLSRQPWLIRLLSKFSVLSWSFSQDFRPTSGSFLLYYSRSVNGGALAQRGEIQCAEN